MRRLSSVDLEHAAPGAVDAALDLLGGPLRGRHVRQLRMDIQESLVQAALGEPADALPDDSVFRAEHVLDVQQLQARSDREWDRIVALYHRMCNTKDADSKPLIDLSNNDDIAGQRFVRMCRIVECLRTQVLMDHSARCAMDSSLPVAGASSALSITSTPPFMSTQPGPTTTSGPRHAPGATLAVGWMSTLPRTPGPGGASSAGAVARMLARCRCTPVM
jgi:hypothetical protein